MEGVLTALWLCALLAQGTVSEVVADGVEDWDREYEIASVDFYGLRKLPAEKARQVLTLKEGDTIRLLEDRPGIDESKLNLEGLRGVVHARIVKRCCDHGKAALYVGIVEKGAPVAVFRDAPSGQARLPEEIVLAAQEYGRAKESAVAAGNATEDYNEGHALARDPAMRAPQEAFIEYGQHNAELLRQVLRSSSNVFHRAMAAQIIAYVPDKQSVVDDLAYGMSDPESVVRTTSMRNLAGFTRITPRWAVTPIRIPYAPFIELLDSPEWNDRYQASKALMELTNERNLDLIASLRREARTSLIEMARWKIDRDAFPSFVILARIAGYSDDELRTAWRKGEREKVIRAAERAKPPRKPVKRRN